MGRMWCAKREVTNRCSPWVMWCAKREVTNQCSPWVIRCAKRWSYKSLFAMGHMWWRPEPYTYNIQCCAHTASFKNGTVTNDHKERRLPSLNSDDWRRNLLISPSIWHKLRRQRHLPLTPSSVRCTTLIIYDTLCIHGVFWQRKPPDRHGSYTVHIHGFDQCYIWCNSWWSPARGAQCQHGNVLVIAADVC